MAYDLSSIQQGRADRPPRIMLLGTEKIGKSTFASQFPNPVFIPIKGEEGIDALSCAAFPTVSRFSEIIEALRTLGEQEHDYKTIVIDSTSALEPLIFAQVCEKNNWENIEKAGYGKGYIEALSEWRKLQECLDWLRKEKGMASILIGHVVVRTFHDPRQMDRMIPTRLM